MRPSSSDVNLDGNAPALFLMILPYVFRLESPLKGLVLRR